MTATVAGVDSSTQSCTVEVREVDTGALVSRTRRPHPPTTPPCSEVDPEAWWSALEPQLDAVDKDVEALSIAGQQHGMVALGPRDAVLRPAKLWNDTESAPEAAALVDRLGAQRWAETSGSVPVAALTISKLAWLQRHEPEVHAATRRVLLPHDWLTWRLTGNAVTDRGDASGTGYWSPRVGEWQAELLDLVGCTTSICPQVLDPTDAAGQWHGVVVGPGTGDNMAAALGLALAPGDVAISIGTSGVVCTVTDEPTADATGAVSGFADATGRFLPLVCTLNASKVTDTIGRLLGVDHETLSDLALGASAGSRGLVLVPYFDGERTPNRPDATGSILGLDTAVSQAEVARAAFEGVVCGLLDALDALHAAGVATSSGRLLVLGGGARAAAYPQLIASLSGREVTVVDDPDQVAAGACIQAAAVLVGTTPLEVARSWSRGTGRIIEPDATVDAAAVRATYRATIAESVPG